MGVREFSFSSAVAVCGMFVSSWLGGWDVALKLLVVLMVFDYVTGLLGAIKNRAVNSEVMFWGGVRKGIIATVIAIAVLLDQMVGNASPILRTLAIYFYIAREAISITENLGILGLPLPPKIAEVLTQLQKSGDK